MSRPKSHLISCECSADIPVSVGQAGDRVACPACGREVGVPKLREFAGLRRAETIGSASQTPWSATHAVLLSGSVLAVLAWAGAFFVLPRGDIVLNAEAIRAAVRAADDRDVYKAWKEAFSRAGVKRPPTDEEKYMQRQSRFSGGISRALVAVGALGAVAAAAAAFRIVSQRSAADRAAAGSPSTSGRT